MLELITLLHINRYSLDSHNFCYSKIPYIFLKKLPAIKLVILLNTNRYRDTTHLHLVYTIYYYQFNHI